MFKIEDLYLIEYTSDCYSHRSGCTHTCFLYFCQGGKFEYTFTMSQIKTLWENMDKSKTQSFRNNYSEGFGSRHEISEESVKLAPIGQESIEDIFRNIINSKPL